MECHQRAFTLIELMVVILIVGILAAAAIPLMRGKIDESKWAEANSAAGMIRSAVKVYYAETGTAVTGSLTDGSLMNYLEITTGDLTGAYFVASDYNIDSVNSDGIATINVTGSQTNAPTGSKTLESNGDWE